MSQEKKNNLRSDKPKYVYLDKFERFKHKMFSAFEKLENDHMKQWNKLKLHDKKFMSIRKWIRALSISILIELGVILFLLWKS